MNMQSFIVWRDENVASPEFGWFQDELERLGIPRLMSPKEMLIRWKAAHSALIYDSSPIAYRLQTLRNNGTDTAGHA